MNMYKMRCPTKHKWITFLRKLTKLLYKIYNIYITYKQSIIMGLSCLTSVLHYSVIYAH